MNWKMMGGTLMVLAFCTGLAGLFAGDMANGSVGVEMQARWAVQCFDGLVSGCRDSRAHDGFVALWKGYGIAGAVGAGLLFMAGAAIFAGSLSVRSVAAVAGDGSDGPDATPEEIAQAEALEREMVLKGILPPGR